jgi:hypothetical protein
MNPARRTFSIHGVPLELECASPLLGGQINRVLEPFEVSSLPDGFVPVQGMIRPYEEDEVLRHLSSSARRLPDGNELVEVYQEDERCWLVDERWGLVEINFLQNRWRSWVAPRPLTDAVRCAEMSILWPMAQLLRARGLHLVPAVSVVRDGWGVLLLSSFTLEPELRAMVRAGFKIIGQRWTALREDDGRLEMLAVPGQMERAAMPQAHDDDGQAASPWVDLTSEHLGCAQNHAFCQSVIITEAGRRSRGSLNQLPQGRAADAIRAAWPITELQPHRRTGTLQAKLAHDCHCCSVQLSRCTGDLMVLLDSLQESAPPVGLNHALRLTLDEVATRAQKAVAAVA